MKPAHLILIMIAAAAPLGAADRSPASDAVMRRQWKAQWIAWLVLGTPKTTKRTELELLNTLKTVFRSLRSQPASRVIERIHPMLRGWGQLLCPRQRQSMLLLCPTVGQEKGETAPCAKLETHWLRLEEVEYAVAGGLSGLIRRIPGELQSTAAEV